MITIVSQMFQTVTYLNYLKYLFLIGEQTLYATHTHTHTHNLSSQLKNLQVSKSGLVVVSTEVEGKEERERIEDVPLHKQRDLH